MSHAWVQLGEGAAFGLGISLAMIRWVAPMGWMDRPDQSRKHHAHPTPRTGGLALWVGLILLQISGTMPFALSWVEWCALHAMAFTGLMDDRFNLSARYKAGAGLVVAAILAVHVSQGLGRIGGTIPFFGMDLPSHPVWLYPFIMAWFWGIPQAYNLIDGVNGLSLGFAALLLGVLGWNLGVQSPILWGGVTAVCALNFPKAHHFLGDCGALMLGTLFAILGMTAFAPRDPNLLLWVFAYPILDVCLVVGIRYWKGVPLGQADRSHLHHWMMERTHGRVWKTTPILLGLAALPMARATAFPGHDLVAGLGLSGLLLLALKVFKDRVTHSREKDITAQIRREIPFMAPSTALREASGSHPKF